MKNPGRISGILFVIAMFFLLTGNAYASGTPVISDEGFVKAYFNLYKEYLSAGNDNANETKDEILDVVDYYLSESEISSNLNSVGSRSRKMIGTILADNGVEFDCGICDGSTLGERCCIYRVGLVPTIYECVGSEVVSVEGYTWVIPVVNGNPMICRDGCCRDKCCVTSDCKTNMECYQKAGGCYLCSNGTCTKETSVCQTSQDCKDAYSSSLDWSCQSNGCCKLPSGTSTTTTSSTTSTTLPGEDNCVDDGDCYSRYGPCWICPAVGKNCTKKVICVTAQDCKDRYSSNVDWRCDSNGCCIPPVTTTTSSTLTSSTSTSSTSSTTTTLPGDNCQNDIDCYGKYGPCSICPTVGGNCSNTTMMCEDAQDCKDRYVSNQDWRCDSNNCCIPPSTTSTTSSSTSSSSSSSTTSTTTSSSTTLETTTTTSSTTSTTEAQECYDGTPVGECSSSFTSLCCVYDAAQSNLPYFQTDTSCAGTGGACGGSPSPTPTVSPTVSPTDTPSPTPTVSPTVTPTIIPTSDCPDGGCCDAGVDSTCKVYCDEYTTVQTINCGSGVTVDTCEIDSSIFKVTCSNSNSQSIQCTNPRCDKDTQDTCPTCCPAGSQSCTLYCKGVATTVSCLPSTIQSCQKYTVGSGEIWNLVCASGSSKDFKTCATGWSCTGGTTNDCAAACTTGTGECKSTSECASTDVVDDGGYCKGIGSTLTCCCSSGTGSCNADSTCTLHSKPGCTGKDGNCMEDYCSAGVMYTYVCDTSDNCVKDPGTACTSGACIDPVSPDTWSHECKATSACSIGTNGHGMSYCKDAANPNGLEDYCLNDKEYHFGCDANDKCIVDTGTACPTGETCIDPVSPDTWSHKCGAGSKTLTVKVTGPSTLYACKDGKYLSSTDPVRNTLKFDISADDSTGTPTEIVDLDVTMSSSPSTGTFDPNSGKTADIGSGKGHFLTFYDLRSMAKITSDITVTVKADVSGKGYPSASGTTTVTVKENKLVLYKKGTDPYVYSTRSKAWNDVKSCEEITYSACVKDSENSKVQSDVKITFTLNDPAKTKGECTVKAGTECCTATGKAPAVKDETTFTVEVTAVATTCYSDADKPTNVFLTVKPVKLIITSLTTDPAGSPAEVKIGDTLKVTAVVMDDSTPAVAVEGATVVFTLGTASSTGVTDKDGKATGNIMVEGPAGEKTLVVTATFEPCYVASKDITDSYTPNPVIVKVTAPTCTDGGGQCYKTAKGCTDSSGTVIDGTCPYSDYPICCKITKSG